MADMTQEIQEKLGRLASVLRPLGRLAIALSGGVDSAVLSLAAAGILGPEQVLAMTVQAPMVSRTDTADAAAAAAMAGIRHIVVNLPDEWLEQPVFRDNPPDRCYHCKRQLFGKMLQVAADEGFSLVADGTNLDDLQEYRPGLQAIRELGVISPFVLAALGKNDIRQIASALCPDFAGKPAMACLATRIPHGTPVTPADLRQIDRAEQDLRKAGFSQIRVRSHQGLARLEIDRSALERGLDGRSLRLLADILHQAGFRYATLDLDGYRAGSMQVAGEENNHDPAV